MIDTKKIDESIIPMNFSWRAGIATQQGALRVVDNPKIDSVTGKPKYDNEYFESLWYELTAELDYELTLFIFNVMNSATYAQINATIVAHIDKFAHRYPVMKSAGFVQYLKDLRMETYQMLMQKLSSEYHEDGYIPVKTVNECELIYVDDRIANRVIINTPKLIEYIIETYESRNTK
jgi:hypothetical protein